VVSQPFTVQQVSNLHKIPKSCKVMLPYLYFTQIPVHFRLETCSTDSESKAKQKTVSMKLTIMVLTKYWLCSDKPFPFRRDLGWSLSFHQVSWIWIWAVKSDSSGESWCRKNMLHWRREFLQGQRSGLGHEKGS